jgi:hypothetical protein
VRTRHYDGVYYNNYAGRRFVAAFPRFQNPEESLIAASKASGIGHLTISGKTPLYPQTKADQKTTKEILAAMKQNKLEWINNHTASDATPLDADLSVPYKRQTNKWCKWNGEQYAYVEHAKSADEDSVFRDGTKCRDGEGYFFKCEPVRAFYDKDGSVQFREGLVGTQFEPQDEYEKRNFKGGEELDTDEFAYGKFMNEEFLPDLMRSVGLENSQTKETENKPKLRETEKMYGVIRTIPNKEMN